MSTVEKKKKKKCATLPILNHMPQTFSLLPVFRPVLSKGASKAKIVWHLSMLL